MIHRLVGFVLLASAALLVPSAAGQVLDAHGNPPGFGGAPDVPGAVISSVLHPITGSKHSDLDVFGTTLLAISAYDSAALIYVLDWFTGAQLATVPTDAGSNFGVGYDNLRGYYLTTDNPNILKRYDGFSPVPVQTMTLPASSPIGVSYDQTRDAYWVCYWASNSITAINAATGATLMTISTAAVGCTRPAGTAYDPVNDEVTVGGRDQNAAFVFNGATGALVRSFPVAGGGNNPQGVASFYSGASLWTSSWNSADIYQLDNGHSLALDLDFSVPGNVLVNITNIPLASDCRLFYDAIVGPYTGAGPYGGAFISGPQILLTLGWPGGIPPLSTFGPQAAIGYGPFALPPGLTINACVVDFVNGGIEPPIRADGGTVL